MDEISFLKKLGFNEYEAKVYLALIEYGSLSVNEITSISKVPRSKTYEILNNLENKNKIITLNVSPKRFKVTNPEMLRQETLEMSNLSDKLVEKALNPKTLNTQEPFWILKGREELRKKVSIQNDLTNKELLMCNSLEKIHYDDIKLIKNIVEKGISVKIIVSFDKNKIKNYLAYQKSGAIIKFFNSKKFGPLLPRLSIYDSKVSRLTIGKPEIQSKKDYITIWSEYETFSLMLKSHFEYMWENSINFEDLIN